LVFIRLIVFFFFFKKKSPLVNEEFIKERYRSGNPLTADEI